MGPNCAPISSGEVHPPPFPGKTGHPSGLRPWARSYSILAPQAVCFGHIHRPREHRVNSEGYAAGKLVTTMPDSLIQPREQALANRLDQMREMDEWHLFQNFILSLLPHDGYTDVRISPVRNDFGRDGVATTPPPDHKKCLVAVSFDCSLSKIRKDAKRWTEDQSREDAAVILFAANDSPQNTKVSEWAGKIKDEFGLELRIYNKETILSTATREGVWTETCARLGIPGYRQGYVKVAPYEGELVRRALKARPPEWLRRLVPLAEWDRLTDTVTSRLIFGKPGSGKTTTIFEQLQRARPDTVIVAESDLSEAAQIEGLLDAAARIEGLLDAATGGAVIVFDDLHENHKTFTSLCIALRTRKQDADV